MTTAQALNLSCTDLVGHAAASPPVIARRSPPRFWPSRWRTRCPCAGATPPPATFCPLGGNPVPVFADGFEAGGANWTRLPRPRDNWGALITDFAKTGSFADGVRAGRDRLSSDHRLAMNSSVRHPRQRPHGVRSRVRVRALYGHEQVLRRRRARVQHQRHDLDRCRRRRSMPGQAYNGTLDPTNALGCARRRSSVRASATPARG